MTLHIAMISLWPVDARHESDVGRALEEAGSSCPTDEEWSVCVYQGREVPAGAMLVTLKGTREKQLISSGSSFDEKRFEYTTVVPGADSRDIAAKLRHAVRAFLLLP